MRGQAGSPPPHYSKESEGGDKNPECEIDFTDEEPETPNNPQQIEVMAQTSGVPARIRNSWAGKTWRGATGGVSARKCLEWGNANRLPQQDKGTGDAPDDEDGDQQEGHHHHEKKMKRDGRGTFSGGWPTLPWARYRMLLENLWRRPDNKKPRRLSD